MQFPPCVNKCLFKSNIFLLNVLCKSQRCAFKILKVGTVVANRGIPIQSYDEPNMPGFSSAGFKPLIELQSLFRSAAVC